MKWIYESIFLILLLYSVRPMWGCVKAWGKFRQLMQDETSLRAVLDHTLRNNASELIQYIFPVADKEALLNELATVHIEYFTTIQKRKLKFITRTILLYALSWFLLPMSFSVFNISLLILLGLAPLPEIIQQQNRELATMTMAYLSKCAFKVDNFESEVCPPEWITAYRAASKQLNSFLDEACALSKQS